MKTMLLMLSLAFLGLTALSGNAQAYHCTTRCSPYSNTCQTDCW